MSLLDYTAVELAAKIKAGETTATEAMEAVIAQIEKSEDELNCYVTFDKEKALAAAKKADEDIKAGKLTGPLAGVPFAIKDNMCTEGMLTTCSSKILGNFVPTYTADAVVRLENAGAVIIGKTNMDEFAMVPQLRQAHLVQLRTHVILSMYLVVHQVALLRQLQQMSALQHLVLIQVVQSDSRLLTVVL